MKKLFLVMAAALLLTACGGSSVKELTKENITEYTSKLSENPLAGEFYLNGEKITAPVSIQDLLDKGWKMGDGKDEKMPSHTMTKTSIKLNNGNASKENCIYVNVTNKKSKEVSITDATIYEVIFQSVNEGQKNTLVLPKGITLASTYDEIIATYGEPKVNVLEDGGYIRYYESDFNVTNKKIEFYFTDDKQTLKEVTLSL